MNIRVNLFFGPNYSESLMSRFLMFASFAILVALASRPCLGDDETEIRQAIMSDSAMMTADFEMLARQAVVPDLTSIEDKSLTLVLLTLELQDNENAREQFRFLTTPHPKPSELAGELYRAKATGKRVIVLQPVTFIHTDRITGITSEIHEDIASGTVSFKVPELYQGKVDYKARKHEGKWYVVEFSLPAYQISIVIGDDGQWKIK